MSLSSAEAEFYAIVSAIAEGKAMQSLMQEMDLCVGLEVMTDSTSAKAFAAKPGLSKMKHIDIKHAYIKQMVQEGLVVMTRVASSENPADMLTKAGDGRSTSTLLDEVARHAVPGSH